MNQVMEPAGLLIIYDFWITDQMKDNEQYTVWYNEKYLKRFPKPPRKEDVWKQEDLKGYFVMDKQINYDMFYEFTMAEFIDFMMIQSNVNEKIENGEMTECEVRACPIFFRIRQGRFTLQDITGILRKRDMLGR